MLELEKNGMPLDKVWSEAIQKQGTELTLQFALEIFTFELQYCARNSLPISHEDKLEFFRSNFDK